ncbi:MAG: hypothetical protein HZB53_07830 [Chloroflexi bacterium]|nr:hypothetical protein [Chloroflexota bacterium]
MILPASPPRSHAVTAAGGNTYTYDLNGNMTLRTEAGTTYTQTWDVDNRLTQVVSSTLATQFAYDADGRRVLQTLPDGTKIAYVGGIEVTITGTQRITKTYYSAGAKLIAMRACPVPRGEAASARVARGTG